MMWRHIERWEGSFLFRAHELEETRHDLPVVGLEILKLRKEVVGHPCVLLTLVLVAKWDGISRRDKFLTLHVQKCSKWCIFIQEKMEFTCHTLVTPRSRVNSATAISQGG